MLHNGLVHYEAWGRGQPIIFLHSWLGSWRYWVPTMEQVVERHRVYALDFWGFGESDRKGCPFNVDSYVEQLLNFIDKLHISETNIVGHGLGGIVGLRAALERPELFAKVVTIGLPLHGSSVANAARTNALTRLFTSARGNVWSRMLRNLNLGNEEIYRDIIHDTESLQPELVQHVIDSIQPLDMTQLLPQIKTPQLLIYSGRDPIVGSDAFEQLRALRWQEIGDGVPNEWEAPIESENGQTHALLLRQSGLFPFIDQEYTFNRLLLDYLSPESSLVIKRAWRRRTSQREFL
jgi:3-oxoadipate enol-lactonase